jgi:catechol 2,3-dioxygenase-like lactoylglutathione lyase family enzyme
MSVRIDHVAIPCRDPETSARFLGGLFALPIEPDGPADEFRSVLFDGGTRVVFQAVAQVTAHHIAFAVEPEVFSVLVDALRARGIAHGNDPEAPENGELGDPLGGRGRVYFRDPDGHLYEACY